MNAHNKLVFGLSKTFDTACPHQLYWWLEVTGNFVNLGKGQKMSNPKTIRRYSAEWFTLFNKFRDEPDETVEIECESEQNAKAMRLEFYKAREAFLRDPEMSIEYGEALESREVKVRGTLCVFDHKDRNWIGQLIAKSLN